MADTPIIVPFDIIEETRLCLVAGMTRDQLLQILRVMRHAVEKGNKHINISWSKEPLQEPLKN